MSRIFKVTESFQIVRDILIWFILILIRTYFTVSLTAKKKIDVNGRLPFPVEKMRVLIRNWPRLNILFRLIRSLSMLVILNEPHSNKVHNLYNRN